MFKKIIFMASLPLLFLSFTGCAKQQNLNTEKVTTPQIKSEILSFKSREGLSFSYPLGWQIITLSDIDLIQPYKDSLKETFKTNVSQLRSIEINFSDPHDIGPYDRNVDIAIEDFVLESPPQSLEEFIKKDESLWGQKGELEKYKSKLGTDFAVWLGQSSVYETDLVIYITQYIDTEGQKHFVEISRMGADHQAMKDALKIIIDSLKFPHQSAP